MKDSKQSFKPFVPADKVLPEFTVTSVILGIILAIVFGGANAYLGLRVGMTVSASIPAAVISMGIIRLIMKKDSILENNMVQTENGWEVDFEDFERKVKDPLVKMFILCSPHNPLGKVWTREELERMLDICFANGVLVVSDEIHSDLIFHGKKHIPTAMVSEEAKSRVISCISGTKTFNLAGLQASTTVFPNMELKQIFDHYWSAMDIHRNNAFSSVAMEAAFNEGEEWLEQVLEYISGNFDYIQDYCAKYIPEIKPSVPDATYLVWLDCRALGMYDETLKEFMIRKAKLGLNPGSSFTRSLTGFMRLNAACPRSVIKKAMEQLRDAVSDLRGSKPCMS